MSTILRVVIVEDDIGVALINREFVSSHQGFTVVGVAHSGGEALELIGRLKPDVVLLDFYLPDFSGLEVLSRLSPELVSSMEVIAVTADCWTNAAWMRSLPARPSAMPRPRKASPKSRYSGCTWRCRRQAPMSRRLNWRNWWACHGWV